MSRVKRGTQHTKRRKNILKRTKGYRWGRATKMRLAKTAILKAGESAFRDRKRKKRLNRQLHNIRINAAVRPLGTSYSVFIDQLKKYGSTLDRKSLSELARNYPAVFQKIVETVKK